MVHFARALQLVQAKYRDGTQVRIVAIRDRSSHVKDAFGHPIEKSRLPLYIWRTQGSESARTVFVDLNVRREPSVAMQLRDGSPPVVAEVFRSAPDTFTAVSTLSHRGALADVSIGVAEGSWKTVGWVSAVAPIGSRESGLKFLTKLKSIPSTRSRLFVVYVALPVAVRTQAWRLASYDKRGKTMRPLSYGAADVNGLPTQFVFVGSQGSIGRVELQARPYEWKTFRDVRW